MSAVMPLTEPVERKQAFQDEWAVRYGILMGGTRLLKLDGIGQFWVGHSEIPRRQLVGFTHQQVGARNEAEDGKYLDEPGGGLLDISPLERKRIVDKSPALCMREMVQMYGSKGFVNSQTLMGDTRNAERIFSVVMPNEITVLPLVDVIDFMQKSDYVDKAFMDGELRSRAQLFREEALQGGFVARDSMTQYVAAIASEIGQSLEKGTGKRGVDSVDIEYFWELKKTLPENKPLEATSLLGKEIAGAMSRGNDNSALVAALNEQNRIAAEANELRRLELKKSKPGRRKSVMRPETGE